MTTKESKTGKLGGFIQSVSYGKLFYIAQSLCLGQSIVTAFLNILTCSEMQ